MDLLNVLAEVAMATGVEVPESDYARSPPSTTSPNTSAHAGT